MSIHVTSKLVRRQLPIVAIPGLLGNTAVDLVLSVVSVRGQLQNYSGLPPVTELPVTRFGNGVGSVNVDNGTTTPRRYHRLSTRGAHRSSTSDYSSIMQRDLDINN